jgi:hypothetical protein
MANPAITAAQIASVAELSDKARALLQENQSPQTFLNSLREKGHFQDAVRFLAHALPKREAVWWAWVCARRSMEGESNPLAKAALDATERWISQPTEDNRRAAMAAAEAADVGTPAGSAGLAAFFSSGSLGPPESPVIPPGPYLTARAVSGSVILAAVGGEPETAPEKYKTFLDQGVDVANRIKLW